MVVMIERQRQVLAAPPALTDSESGVGVAGRLPRQHGGQRGRDTVWLTVNPANVPVWLRPYGGALADGARILKEMSTARPGCERPGT